MEIMTNKEAKERGLKTYFNGRDCKNGHTPCERYTTNGKCIFCIRDGSKRYYAGNKERVRITQSEYEKRPDVKERRSRLSKSESRRGKRRVYYQDYYSVETNTRRLREYSKTYVQEHKLEGRIRRSKYRALLLQRSINYGVSWLEGLLILEKYIIAETLSKVTGEEYRGRPFLSPTRKICFRITRIGKSTDNTFRGE